ncbi:MAG: dihydrofolate reductase [Chthoniobacterales bacterium]
MKAIVAMTTERLIGANGKLPWHLPGDLKFFKQTTIGHRIVMGRKTWDSIGRALPKRENVVLTRDKNFSPPAEVRVFHDVAELLESNESLEAGRECFVIGGAEIYRLLLPHCAAVYVTEVKGNFEGDTYLDPFEEEFPQSRILSEAADYRIRVFLRRL